jgi:hypothetical protein
MSYSCSSALIGMELVGRWWNGARGRHLRRDIWLIRDQPWTVKARQVNAETGRESSWEFTTEHEARAMVNRLIRADVRNDWKDITRLVRDRPGPQRLDMSPDAQTSHDQQVE